MDKSGKWLILALVAIAFASGGFSWWFRWSATHRAANFWGPEAATTIRDAQTVTATKRADHHSQSAESGSQPGTTKFDASQAPGLVHLKQALLEDRSFVWDQLPPAEPFAVRWSIDFAPLPGRSGSPVQVQFDDAGTHCGYAIDGRHSPVLKCSPKFTSGLLELLADWFANE